MVEASASRTAGSLAALSALPDHHLRTRGKDSRYDSSKAPISQRPCPTLGRGRVLGYDVHVRCGEVLVYPGALILADFDGIVVVLREVYATYHVL